MFHNSHRQNLFVNPSWKLFIRNNQKHVFNRLEASSTSKTLFSLEISSLFFDCGSLSDSNDVCKVRGPNTVDRN